jgi:hypothetical protein
MDSNGQWFHILDRKFTSKLAMPVESEGAEEMVKALRLKTGSFETGVFC